jgi:DNA helicase-2/ATP-dependent DNA helicase PcrA
LITLAYQLLRRKIACKVLGRDIGAGVKGLVRKLRAKDLPDLLERADQYLAEQTAKLRASDKEDQVEALEDRVETLRAFALEAHTLADVERAIDDLFADDVSEMVTLSTVHKAKGAEAPRVVILDPRRMPSKGARQDWEIQQERNIVYVAYTRARETLIFASLDGAPAFPPTPF